MELLQDSIRSLPTRGAWIEIGESEKVRHRAEGRSPRGERGLKSRRENRTTSRPCRSPRGERGLKFEHDALRADGIRSLPTRGAWIEILKSRTSSMRFLSLPTRGAWIEIRCRSGRERHAAKSLPTRGAWIEMSTARRRTWTRSRSPRGERGLKYQEAGGREEGAGSLPTRGAWIEIRTAARPRNGRMVAPHAGSVD